jgi:hypothetical protein
MADPVIEPVVTPAPGTDPKPPANPGNNVDLSTIDFSKLSQTQIDQLYANQNLYGHPRFKDLSQAKKERDDLLDKRKKEEDDLLIKNKQFEDLAKKREEEATDLRTQLANTKIDNVIERAAVKAGAVDSEAVLKLIDRSAVKVDENGNVTGVDEAINSIKTSKGYLFGTGSAASMGNPSNPGGDNAGVKRYKQSEIDAMPMDTYNKEEKDIKAAYNAGMVEDRRFRN